jgi:hypothetical protein
MKCVLAAIWIAVLCEPSTVSGQTFAISSLKVSPPAPTSIMPITFSYFAIGRAAYPNNVKVDGGVITITPDISHLLLPIQFPFSKTIGALPAGDYTVKVVDQDFFGNEEILASTNFHVALAQQQTPALGPVVIALLALALGLAGIRAAHRG